MVLGVVGSSSDHRICCCSQKGMSNRMSKAGNDALQIILVGGCIVRRLMWCFYFIWRHILKMVCHRVDTFTCWNIEKYGCKFFYHTFDQLSRRFGVHWGACHTGLEGWYRALESNVTVTKNFLLSLLFSLTVDKLLTPEQWWHVQKGIPSMFRYQEKRHQNRNVHCVLSRFVSQAFKEREHYAAPSLKTWNM